jgi:hypothetical protein
MGLSVLFPYFYHIKILLMQDNIRNLNAFKYNVKAEAVTSSLILNGIKQENIFVDFKGSHRKNWDHDILSFDVSGEKIILRLSRDSILQSLPENLFFKKIEGSSFEKEKIKEFNASQEKYANLVFNPIENEIFTGVVTLDGFENNIITSLDSCSAELLDNYFNVDDTVAPDHKAKLIKLIPMIHSIVGDYNLTAKCLEYFLEVPVDWLFRWNPTHLNFSADPTINLMGNTCGVNMITAGDYCELTPTIVFKIGPIHSSDIKSYLDYGKNRNLLVCFSNYFLPLNFDLDYELEIEQTENEFTLNDAYLNFNTAIN